MCLFSENKAGFSNPKTKNIKFGIAIKEIEHTCNKSLSAAKDSSRFSVNNTSSTLDFNQLPSASSSPMPSEPGENIGSCRRTLNSDDIVIFIARSNDVEDMISKNLNPCSLIQKAVHQLVYKYNSINFVIVPLPQRFD